MLMMRSPPTPQSHAAFQRDTPRDSIGHFCAKVNRRYVVDRNGIAEYFVQLNGAKARVKTSVIRQSSSTLLCFLPQELFLIARVVIHRNKHICCRVNKVENNDMYYMHITFRTLHSHDGVHSAQIVHAAYLRIIHEFTLDSHVCTLNGTTQILNTARTHVCAPVRFDYAQRCSTRRNL